jgi:sulfur-oxidizing protein SoxZ
MAQIRARVKVPKTASVGEIINIKSLISHPMESGQRKDSKTGELIPRQIIHTFEAFYNDAPVFTADLHGAVSANPFIEFSALINEAGTFVFKWHDDDGSVYEETAEVSIA